MLKYYILLFLFAGGILYYIFLEDPCNKQVKTDFSNLYPDYEILYSGATDGSPENVHCHISYKKPDNQEIYEDIIEYINSGSGWKFSRVLETHGEDQTP